MRTRSLREIFRPRDVQALQSVDGFQEKYDAHAQAMAAISLSVLIWGPSLVSSSAAAQKRKDIHRALLSDGHKAMFSEDIAFASNRLSLRANELAQALAADLIILLVEDAPGAQAELEGLCMRREIAPKVYVLVPEYYRSSYSGVGAYRLLDEGYGAVFWYQEEDLVLCNVLTRALQRANARREIVAMSASVPSTHTKRGLRG